MDYAELRKFQGYRSWEGGGVALLPMSQFWGRSFNPISTSGADYASHITTFPLDFQTFLRPWVQSIIIISTTGFKNVGDGTEIR